MFTNKYIYKHLELTTRDLLLKVSRITPPEKPAQVLTAEEIERVLDTFDRPTYEDIRNRALVACYIATGLRLREVLDLPLLLDRSGDRRDQVHPSQGEQGAVRLALHGAMKHVKAYLRVGPHSPQDEQLWLQADGRPLSILGRPLDHEAAAGAVWHRQDALAPLPSRLRPGSAEEGCRHGHGPGDAGAHSNAMTRRYAGQVTQTEAARKMPKFAPI